MHIVARSTVYVLVTFSYTLLNSNVQVLCAGLPDLARKCQLAAVGTIKVGFGTLLPFGLLVKTLVATLGDLRCVCALHNVPKQPSQFK